MNIIQNDLAFKFSEINQEKDVSKLFIRIADYGRYVLDNNILKVFIEDFEEQSKKDMLSYKSACDKFYDTWKELTTDLLNRTESVETSNNNDIILRSIIEELKSAIDAKPNYEDDYFSGKYRKYLDLLGKLVNDQNLSEFIPKHIFMDENYKKYVLSDYFTNTQTEWEKFEKIRDLSVWWSHIQIMRLTHGFFNIADKDGYFSNNRIIAGLYKLDFDKIAKGQTNDLFFLKSSKYFQWIRILHNFLVVRIETIPENFVKTEIKGIAKLNYFPDDEMAEYKGVQYKPKGKGRSLLKGLCECKNLPLSCNEIGSKCNPLIKNIHHYFHCDKDVYDTIEYMKKKLKVNKSEYFPLHKIGANWIWDQK